MKAAAFLVALSFVLLPLSSSAKQPFGRQLHYEGTRVVGDERVAIRIDLDIGRLENENVTWALIDEHVGNRDLGPQHASIDKSGVIEDAGTLTFEEETLLEMVALQFEDVDGVDPGDHWVRSGMGRQTNYLVRSTSPDGTISFEISRTVQRGIGSGTCRGAMSYNARSAAPTALQYNGELVGRPIEFSVRLVADSFQPGSN